MFEPSGSVHLAIVSDSRDLEKAIGDLKCPAIAQLDVETLVGLPAETSRADVAIVCGAPDGYGRLRDVFPQALIVWLAHPDDMAKIPPGACVDEVWTAPMGAAELVHKFACLMNRHAEKRKNDFYAKATDAAINNLPDIVWFKSNTGIHLKVNDAFCACVGKERSDVEGHDHFHVWGLTREEYEDSDYVCVDTDVIVNTTRKPGVFDELVMSARGLRQFKTYKSPILDEAGELLGTVGIARDITDLRNIDAKLKIVLDSVPFALLVTDETGRAIHTNPKFEELFHVPSGNVLGKPVDISALVEIVSRKDIHGGAEEELCIRVGDGATAQVVVRRADILDIFNNVVGCLSIYIDVTRSREIDSKLKEMAYTDALTGLYTRHYLFQKLDDAPETDGIALLSIDLDNFKSVNDNYGHAAGDELLKRVGKIIREAFPRALCVRLGGDEFLVVEIGDVDEAGFADTAQSLLGRLKDAFASADYARGVSSSGGIAFSPFSRSENFDALLSESDKALYQAKKSGKGCIVALTRKKVWAGPV